MSVGEEMVTIYRLVVLISFEGEKGRVVVEDPYTEDSRTRYRRLTDRILPRGSSVVFVCTLGNPPFKTPESM